MLAWSTENEFSRNFSTLQGISSKKKYGESTTSNLLLNKLMLRSLLSLFKICGKSKGLKTFFWELAEFPSGIFKRQYSGYLQYLQKVLIW